MPPMAPHAVDPCVGSYVSLADVDRAAGRSGA